MSEQIEKPKGKQGFASMSEEKRRAIAAKGGRAAHKKGTAYRWDSKLASVAGRKGGQASSKSRQQMRKVAMGLTNS